MIKIAVTRITLHTHTHTFNLIKKLRGLNTSIRHTKNPDDYT